MEILNWVIKHWPELAAAIGIGGGSGFAAKKLTDKKQDGKISELETKVNALDKTLTKVQSDIETNTKFDKQFRDQVEASMTEVKTRLDQILGHLLNNKT